MFLGPHKMKMSHYFISLWYPLELGTFFISKDPQLFPTETWDFLNFWRPPPPIIWTVSQVSPLFSLESFPMLSTSIKPKFKLNTIAYRLVLNYTQRLFQAYNIFEFFQNLTFCGRSNFIIVVVKLPHLPALTKANPIYANYSASFMLHT